MQPWAEPNSESVIHSLIHRQDINTHSDSTKARFPLPELTHDLFPLPVNVNTGRVDRRVFPLAELTASGNARPEMETGHPSTRAVNSGSGHRA